MLNSMKTFACSVAVVAAATLSADAATVSVATVAQTDLMLASLAAGNTTGLPTGALFNHFDIVSGSGGPYRSPFENLSGGTCSGACANIQYYTVGSNKANSASPATLSFSSPRSGFSMLWGSVDDFNTLNFYNGSTLVFTAQGKGNVNPGTGRGAVFVSVAGLTFDKVQFISPKTAFEFSNISTVPVPAAGLLLLTAFGGFAALRRRKA